MQARRLRSIHAVSLLVMLLGSSLAGPSAAFTHIVRPNDTLASIADTYYGRVQYEKILVAANSLDAREGARLVPGMRLEVPAVSHYRAEASDSFKSLAETLLGAEERSVELAEANDSKPWLPPAEGVELVIPYNLRIVCTGHETLPGLAYQFLGDRKKAWNLDYYNNRDGKPLERGETLLIPLADLPLTEAGQVAARRAQATAQSEGRLAELAAQRSVNEEMASLIADTRGGRYVEAVVRGTEFLSRGQLSKPQRAVIQRQLLEAYVALGAQGRAREACERWLEDEPDADLDPIELSPKILSVCQKKPQ
jgi:hypothetical protein